MDKKPQDGGMGQAMAQQVNNCGKAFSAGSAADKQNCRGDMNSDCANAMDNSCKNTGLYNILTSNPQSASPYPDACNSSFDTYSETSCFNWIENNLIKGTVAFDFQKFQKLPEIISQGITSSAKSRLLRYLQTVAADPTKSDTKAQVSGTISDTDMTVDSATATKIPDANIYVQNLNSVTTTTALSTGSSYVCISFSVMIIAIFGLFF
jgi:hypothetical protein